MINLLRLESLIEAQEELLKNLKPTLELAEKANATAKSLKIELTATAIRRSEREKLCTALKGSEEWNNVTSSGQRARDRAQRAEKNYENAQQKYNGHLQEYNRAEAELQRLIQEYKTQQAQLQRQQIVRALQSFNWLSETAHSATSGEEKAADNFLNSRVYRQNR